MWSIRYGRQRCSLFNEQRWRVLLHQTCPKCCAKALWKTSYCGVFKKLAVRLRLWKRVSHWQVSSIISGCRYVLQTWMFLQQTFWSKDNQKSFLHHMPDAVIHSFRRSFHDRLMSAGVQSDMIDQLGGWSNQTVGHGYGEGYSLAVLRKCLSLENQISKTLHHYSSISPSPKGEYHQYL